MGNRIRSMQTVSLDGPDGPANAIMVAVDLMDPESAPAFVRDVAEQVKLHRMCSPPDTSMLLLTLIGPADARVFTDPWHASVAADPALAHFVGAMSMAEGVLGTHRGTILSEFPLRR